MAPRRTVLDWALEALSLITLAAIFGVVLANWAHLPARIPRHFYASGAPNRWGDKTGLLLLPVTATGLYLLLTTASRFQKLINLPITIDRHAPEVQSLLLGMSITLKAIVLLIFLYIVWASVNTAMGRSAGLGKPFLPISLAVVFLAMGLYLFKLRRYRE